MKVYELVKELTITKSHAHFDSIRNTRKIICQFPVTGGISGRISDKTSTLLVITQPFFITVYKALNKKPIYTGIPILKMQLYKTQLWKDIYVLFRVETSESWVTGNLHKFTVKGFWLTVNDNITISIIILVNRNPGFPFWL